MRKSLLIVFGLMVMIFILHGCVASYQKLNAVVSVSPVNPVAGEKVLVTLDTIPRYSVYGSLIGGKLRIDGKVVKIGSDIPLSYETVLAPGTHVISGVVRTYDSIYESSPLTIYVEAPKDNYKVLLNIENTDVSIGDTVNIKVGLSNVPEVNWVVKLFIGGNLVYSSNAVPFQYDWKTDSTGRFEVKAVLEICGNAIDEEKSFVNVKDITPPQILTAVAVPHGIVDVNDPVFLYITFNDDSKISKVVSVFKGDISEVTPSSNYAYVKIADNVGIKGTYKAFVSIFNEYGLSDSTEITFNVTKVDKVPPEVDISFFKNKKIFSPDEDVIVTANASDDVAIKSYAIYVDGTKKIETNFENGGPSELTIERDIGKLSEGFHSVRVEVYDESGKYGSSESVVLINPKYVDVTIFMAPEKANPGDMVSFVVTTSASEDEISHMEFQIDDDVLYTFDREATDATDLTESTSLKTVFLWKAITGVHYIICKLELTDGRQGLDVLKIYVRDYNPPVVKELKIGDTTLNTEYAVKIEPGRYKVTLVVQDDYIMPSAGVVELEIWDDGMEPILMGVVPMTLEELSTNMKEAIYTVELNFSIGSYYIIPRNIMDAMNNILKKGPKYLLKVGM